MTADRSRPAHSKSEYKRRVIQGDPSVTPPAADALPAAEPCPRGLKGQPEPSCTNRHQCWEPCGLLGKSAAHVRIGAEPKAIIDSARAPLPAASEPASGAVQVLREALALAVRQNSHDMLMTGEELRQCEAALSSTAAAGATVKGVGKLASVATIIDKVEHLLCVASDADKAEVAGDTDEADRLDMELKRGVEAIEQALGGGWKCNPQCHARDCREAQACQRRDDPPCGHMLRGVRKDYCPRCRRAAAGATVMEAGIEAGTRTIHGITLERDSDGSFAVTMPDRWFSASPENDAEDNLEGEVCMLLDHLWNAAPAPVMEAAAAVPAARNVSAAEDCFLRQAIVASSTLVAPGRLVAAVGEAKPIMSLAEFCAEGKRLNLTAADLVPALRLRPEFADCLPAGVQGDGVRESVLTERDAEAVKNLYDHMDCLAAIWEDRSRPKGERHYLDGAMDLQTKYTREWLGSIEAEWVRSLWTAPAGTAAADPIGGGGGADGVQGGPVGAPVSGVKWDA